MLVRTLGEAELSPAYGILFQQLYPAGGEDLADWGIGRSVVEPGGSTEAHAHDEHEIFIVTTGVARIAVDGETRQVPAGEAVLVPIGAHHQITNASTDRRLEFLNVYWPASFGAIDL
jgi:mannose-6-phosphate isomerase-like protein (cupin superfamily)